MIRFKNKKIKKKERHEKLSQFVKRYLHQWYR